MQLFIRFTLIIAFIFFADNVTAQINIPLINGDIEDRMPMHKSPYGNNPYVIKKMFISLNSGADFVVKESGLAAGEGVDGSQAFKATVVADKEGEKSAAVGLNFGPYNISDYGPGRYTFTFHAKTLEEPMGRPFWVTAVTSSSDTNMNSDPALIRTYDDGGTVSHYGMSDGYQKQSITFELLNKKSNFIRIGIQSGKYSNTYFFDDLKLSFTPLN